MNISKFVENLKNLKKNKKNINLHISQQRLEIEGNGLNFFITYIVDVHSKTFQIFKKKIQNLNYYLFLFSLKQKSKMRLSQKQFEIEQHD